MGNRSVFVKKWKKIILDCFSSSESHSLYYTKDGDLKDENFEDILQIKDMNLISLLQRSSDKGLRVPDFLCIGAQKAGSTWIQNIMSNHEQIVTPEVVESLYFNSLKKLHPNSWEEYLRSFSYKDKEADDVHLG